MNPDIQTNLADSLISITPGLIDLPAFCKATQDLVARYPFGSGRQICLTHRPEVTDSLEKIYEGAGRLKPGLTEFDYSEINTELRGSYFFDFLTAAKQNGQLGRTRLLLLPPHSCYSLHRDLIPFRYHVVIQTNKNCFMVYRDFPGQQLFHMPADGRIYKMDVRHVHTAFNGGNTDRIHFVFQFAPPLNP